MKTHLFFDFQYKDTTWKELISTIQLPEPVYDVKFIELADYSPPAVFFVFSCDIIESYSNDEERPILAFRLSGTGETQLMPVDPCKSNVRELTISMFHRNNAPIYANRQKAARAHVILHSGSLRDSQDYCTLASLKSSLHTVDMRAKYFMLKVTSSDESNKIHSVVFKLPEPIFNAKYLKVLNWFASGGPDFITSPLIQPTICNDPLVKEPIVAFGVEGVSKKHEPMPLVDETLNEVTISIQRVWGSNFHRNHSFIQFCILYQ